jgi:hypothetical protein
MDHYELSDELRQQLLENAAWGKAGVTPRLDETVRKAKELAQQGMESAETAGGATESSRDTDDGTSEPAPAWRKGGRRPPKKGKKKDDEGAINAGTEHVCPLCVSQLEEALDEERILEHLNVVVGLVDRLSQLQEGDEDIDTVIDETLSQLLFQDLDEE